MFYFPSELLHLGNVGRGFHGLTVKFGLLLSSVSCQRLDTSEVYCQHSKLAQTVCTQRNFASRGGRQLALKLEVGGRRG